MPNPEQSPKVNRYGPFDFGVNIIGFEKTTIGTIAVLQPPAIILPDKISVLSGDKSIIPKAHIAVFTAANADFPASALLRAISIFSAIGQAEAIIHAAHNGYIQPQAHRA